jgi:hypothetical protein
VKGRFPAKVHFLKKFEKLDLSPFDEDFDPDGDDDAEEKEGEGGEEEGRRNGAGAVGTGELTPAGERRIRNKIRIEKRKGYQLPDPNSNRQKKKLRKQLLAEGKDPNSLEFQKALATTTEEDEEEKSGEEKEKEAISPVVTSNANPHHLSLRNPLVPKGFVRPVQPFEEVILSPYVGYYSCAVDESRPQNEKYRVSFASSSVSSEEFWISCPLTVLSYREGIHGCSSTGKQSLSRFRCLGYDERTNTSLIECKPYTGRTHQLRLHLQLIGNPIANDPCYGGELFYNNQTKKDLALKVLQKIQASSDHRPLSKLPHINQLTSEYSVETQREAEDNHQLLEQQSEQQQKRLSLSKAENQSTTTQWTIDVLKSINNYNEEIKEIDIENQMKTSPYFFKPAPNETNDEFLIKTCK